MEVGGLKEYLPKDTIPKKLKARSGGREPPLGPYGLLEESRKSWDHFISDKVVYFSEAGGLDHEPTETFWKRLKSLAYEYRAFFIWLRQWLSGRNLAAWETVSANFSLPSGPTGGRS